MNTHIQFSKLLFTSIIFLLFFIFSCNKNEHENTNIKPNVSADSTIAKEIDEDSKMESIEKVAREKTNNWKTFEGLYFSINYPDNFKVNPSIKSDGSKYNSVFFVSPDKTVEFYVYSPLWNGEATDVAVDKSKEIILSEESIIKNGIETKYLNIEAKDKSYERSYLFRENINTNNLTVYGIKYKTKDDYDYYLNDYLKFKKSIEQWSDGE